MLKQQFYFPLSQEIDALFIESSAKDGSNVIEAIIELTR